MMIGWDFKVACFRSMQWIILNHAPIMAYEIGLREVLSLSTADNDNGGDVA